MKNEKYTTKDLVEDVKCVLAVIGGFAVLYGWMFLCCID